VGLVVRALVVVVRIELFLLAVPGSLVAFVLGAVASLHAVLSAAAIVLAFVHGADVTSLVEQRRT
jgi:hypothetical protein